MIFKLKLGQNLNGAGIRQVSRLVQHICGTIGVHPLDGSQLHSKNANAVLQPPVYYFLMCSAHPDPCYVNYCVYLSIVIYACTHSALPRFLLIVVVHVVHDVNSATIVGLRSR